MYDVCCLTCVKSQPKVHIGLIARSAPNLMMPEEFTVLIGSITARIEGRRVDAMLAEELRELFPAHGAGWVVYAPGSAHRPTVSDGKALVVYLLPQGTIEFSKS